MKFAPIALLMVLASPLQAWTFSTLPVCKMSTTFDGGEVDVTFDPATGLYAIVLRYTDGVKRWDEADGFAIGFAGGLELQIGTDQHQLSADQSELTVTDRGFGNVLNGMESNSRAIAQSGESGMNISLQGASEVVKAFRECATIQLS